MWLPTEITVEFNFTGIHRWPGATGAHAYLANPHRHVFYGTAEVEVRHDDRELEFLAVQDLIETFTDEWPYDLGTRSCEQLAREIAEELLSAYGLSRNVSVTVLEDGENGATVTWMHDRPHNEMLPLTDLLERVTP